MQDAIKNDVKAKRQGQHDGHHGNPFPSFAKDETITQEGRGDHEHEPEKIADQNGGNNTEPCPVIAGRVFCPVVFLLCLLLREFEEGRKDEIRYHPKRERKDADPKDEFGKFLRPFRKTARLVIHEDERSQEEPIKEKDRLFALFRNRHFWTLAM